MSLKGSNTTADYINFEKTITTGFKLLESEKTKTFGLYIIISSNTGLRASDVLNLKWSQLKGDEIVITEKKTGKRRLITINDYIKKAVNYFDNRDGFVFTNNEGNVYSIQHINRTLKNIFYRENRTLNISTHSMRKAFGRRVYEVHNESEKALIYLSDLFNHSNMQITRRYLGIRQEELQEVYLGL